MINYTAIDQLFTTSIMQNTVVQNGHGFVVGNVLYYTGALYAKAHNDTQTTAQTVGIVSAVISPNIFIVTQAGFVTTLGGPFTPGTQYYLDGAGNPGGLTTVPPVASGTWVVPLFMPVTNTIGYYFNNYGKVNGPGGTTFPWTTIVANQTLAVENGYFVNGGGALNNLLLPPVAMVGDTIEVWDIGGNGFTITQSAAPNQQCLFGTGVTTLGNTGSIVSALKGNKITIVCQTANTIFAVNPDNGMFSTT